MSKFNKLKNDLDVAHLKQLRIFSGAGEKPPVYKTPDEIESRLLNWIDEQEKKGRIDKAKKSRVTTPKDQNTPDWNNAMFAIIESEAMYLRNDEDMLEAIKAAQGENYEVAKGFLYSAQARIDKIAKRLGLKFVQLCDMAETPGSNVYSGAFCGMFVSDTDDCKFIGVVFKGTTEDAEWWTNFQFKPIKAPEPILYGTEVHTGFYYGIFDMFNQDGIRDEPDLVQPFELIMNGLLQFDDSYYLHVTGHSLGAAFATLLHCELNRLVGNPNGTKAILKDVMTLGSPRVGLNDFANKVGQNLRSDQKSWRFATVFDPVTIVPLKMMRYVHVDVGYLLYDDAEPQPIISETNHALGDDDEDGQRGVVANIMKNHGLDVYYERIDRIAD